MSLRPRLFVLPGMGASKAMYGAPWRQLTHATLLDWPEYRGETTLSEVAARVVEEAGITALDVPIGSSLGGMVALEIAAHLGAARAGLIGSARSGREISGWLRLAAPLASVTPIRWVQTLVGSSGGPELVQEFARADADFLRAMCGAIAAWEAPDYDGRVLRVHGERDHVIPCPDDPDTRVIRGGGHLLACTHGEETVLVLRDLLKASGCPL